MEIENVQFYRHQANAIHHKKVALQFWRAWSPGADGSRWATVKTVTSVLSSFLKWRNQSYNLNKSQQLLKRFGNNESLTLTQMRSLLLRTIAPAKAIIWHCPTERLFPPLAISLSRVKHTSSPSVLRERTYANPSVEVVSSRDFDSDQFLSSILNACWTLYAGCMEWNENT